jgi:hypothetical protein
MINQALKRARPDPADHGDAQWPVLLGVRRQDLRAGSEAARGLGRKLAERGEIAYWVVSNNGGSDAEKGPDQRAQARSRARLRSVKLLDGGCRFLSEGRICDRSREGLRLALPRDIALPPKLAVHIDETSEVLEAKVVWRRGSTIGVRLQGALPADAMTASQRYALKERYYAIPS